MLILASTSLTAINGVPGSGGAVDRYLAPVGVTKSAVCAPFFVSRGDAPARRLFGVVAPFALTQPIGGTGRPATVARCGVIVMPNRRITVRGATGAVSQADESGQTLREQPRSRLHRHQRSALGVPIQPPQRRQRRLSATAPRTRC